MKIEESYIWTAYQNRCIGSKCGNRHMFEHHLANLIKEHDTSKDRAKGQHFITLTEDAILESEISCGVGRRTMSNGERRPPSHYVIREHRAVTSLFLKREYALPVANCAVIVYTREALLSDPQSSKFYKDVVEKQHPDATHFLVALLANALGVPSPAPRSPFRLLDCLAGGNNEAETWTLEEVKEMAKASCKYAANFMVVADD